jgi:hypothetical protein
MAHAYFKKSNDELFRKSPASALMTMYLAPHISIFRYDRAIQSDAYIEGKL